ncbi:MAG: PAS domain S-box protein [Candidatus Eisenbacteria bacterium]|uniref:histidine kinase n=1 Tax=Eiseniibacteriota bacterium TaxID=2212470 RepID=A0A933SE41_UNCEI|nr:PAS domain S-box protein [Candidatus Eisenbacteria bacterium]
MSVPRSNEIPSQWHPLLARQLRRAFGAHAETSEPLQRLLALVDRSYRDRDDQRGLVEHSLATMTEELNERNNELAEQLERLRRQACILEYIHEAVFVIDRAGTILTCNSATAELFGCATSELEQESLRRFLATGESDQRFEEILTGAIESARWSGDVGFTRADGRALLAEATVVRQGSSADDRPEFVVVARDVTDRRLMERQLLQSQKMEAIGQLAAGIAHEINTPAQYVADNLRFLDEGFTTISRALGEWRAGAPPTPELEEELAIYESEMSPAIHQSLDGMARVAAIVRGMRTFAHPGGSSKSAVDLNAEIASTVTVSRNEWKYVSEVVTEFDPDLPPVPAIAGEINHVFLNIIVNAAHAIEERLKTVPAPPGRILIQTRREDDEVVVRISDNGCGIPEAIRERVFDHFFTTKPVGKGTGQGLSIVHRLVYEKHGGSIQFEPAHPTGTTFVIRLPLGGTGTSVLSEAA